MDFQFCYETLVLILERILRIMDTLKLLFLSEKTGEKQQNC